MSRRTPAGAYLRIRRDARWVVIDIDRWPIRDAGPQQAAMFRMLSVHASSRCFALGRRKPIIITSGQTTCYLTAPRADEAVLLAALLAVEQDDYGPAFEYLLADELGAVR